MITKDLTYIDHDGKQVTRKFYFALTEYDVVEINLLDDIKTIHETQDIKQVLKVLRRIVRLSVGRNEQGDFIKNDHIADAFMASPASSALLMSFFTADNPESVAIDFIRGVMPTNLIDQMDVEEKALDDKNKKEN